MYLIVKRLGLGLGKAGREMGIEMTVSQSGQVEMKIKYLHPTAFWLFLEGNPNPFAVL